ncbi:MAG TPA: phospholipase A [Pusillimonas sp.]|uniref:phospholipase A n=1 Tax=Pusillimonas sp. TaxID=3040095 RepID=UPI002C7997DC|nr:phospholipase A [Pusillimonas sp.]HUH88754.1 phospholipase A [Pusillimonas sp.]
MNPHPFVPASLRRRPAIVPRFGYALCWLALAAGLHAQPAAAGMNYQLNAAHAAPGETVQIKGILFNDTDNALTWTPPTNLVLQWRNEQGRVIRSLAQLQAPAQQVNLPVNNFAAFSWQAVVPTEARGLQAVNIEGEPVMLALDTTPGPHSVVAGSPAHTPIIDAGAAPVGTSQDPPLPDTVATALGADSRGGPRPTSAASPDTQDSTLAAFDNFRNAISPYEPVYLDVGQRDGTNARFQLSFKYRLSTPKDPAQSHFFNHFYLGYTQLALWDLDGDSKPFVDVTYNPSLFWHKEKVWSPSEHSPFYVGLASGVEHKSNGRSGTDSRSLNDVFIQPELRYRFGGGSTLTFAPRIKTYFAKNENNDYADYAGHVDWKLRWAQDNGLILSGLYRQGASGRTAMQVEAAWPLRRSFLNMNGYLHVQYFKGYGETLLGYNQKSSGQVRLGLALVP